MVGLHDLSSGPSYFGGLSATVDSASGHSATPHWHGGKHSADRIGGSS
ncbi:hypothetical protein [Streptomyces regalis]|nr:hypothetical protein [Streptomyces regalis]